MELLLGFILWQSSSGRNILLDVGVLLLLLLLGGLLAVVVEVIRRRNR